MLNSGGPCPLEDEVLATNAAAARSILREESARARHIPDPGVESMMMSDADLSSLRKKFPFLADFSDEFVRSKPMETLLKIETTSIKIREMDRVRDVDDRLSANKMAMATTSTNVPAGTDNRWTVLHPARFLPGAACSTTKLWLAARNSIGMSGHPPVGNYDLSAVGLGGCVTSKGWLELHNPSSTRLSIRMFTINNCTARAGRPSTGDSRETTEDDIQEIGELRLALRTLRTAASFVHPWNFSFLAIENFMIQTMFCQTDLAGVEKKAALLTQFIDYVIGQNADRWRDSEPFLSTGELKSAWASYFGARPQAALANRGKTEKKTNNRFQEKRKWLDICFPWNSGHCLKSPGDCKSVRGTALRHVCNFIPDRNRPDVVCGKDHTRISFHK